MLSRLWPDVTDEPQLVRMALASGDRELAESAADNANRRAELSRRSLLAAVAAHAAGLLNADVDELTHAVNLFEGARARWRSPRHGRPRLAQLQRGSQEVGDRFAHQGSRPLYGGRGDA